MGIRLEDDLSFDFDVSKLVDAKLEQNVLGLLLFSPDVIFLASDCGLNEEWFYVPSHFRVFQAIKSVHGNNQAVNMVSVTVEVCKGLTQEQQVDYKNLVFDLVANCTADLSFDVFVTELRRRWMARKVIETAQEMIERVLKGDDPDNVRVESTKKLDDIGQSTDNKLVPIADVFNSVCEDIAIAQEARESGKPITTKSIPTGFYDIDAMLAGGGLRVGELYLPLGRPGSCKTTFLCQLAIQVASAGHPVAFFSLEMSKDQIAENLLANLTNTDRDLLVRQDMPPDWWDKTIPFIDGDRQLPIWISDDREHTMDSILANSLKLKRRGGLGLIIVDYLDLVKVDSRLLRLPEYQRLTEVSRGLVITAGKAGAPMVCAAQASRTVEGRADKRPLLSDFGGSDGPARNAHSVFALYNDEEYNPETTKPGVLEVILRKNRSGPKGSVELIKKLEESRLLNMSRRP